MTLAPDDCSEMCKDLMRTFPVCTAYTSQQYCLDSGACVATCCEASAYPRRPGNFASFIGVDAHSPRPVVHGSDRAWWHYVHRREACLLDHLRGGPGSENKPAPKAQAAVTSTRSCLAACPSVPTSSGHSVFWPSVISSNSAHRHGAVGTGSFRAGRTLELYCIYTSVLQG